MDRGSNPRGAIVRWYHGKTKKERTVPEADHRHNTGNSRNRAFHPVYTGPGLAGCAGYPGRRALPAAQVLSRPSSAKYFYRRDTYKCLMGVTGTKKEMLFVLGMFFNKTSRRFSKFPLDVSVSKAEFIDVIISMKTVAKQKRALYKNLEGLQKDKYILYDDRNLRLTRKGFNEYEKVRKEVERYRKISDSIAAGRIKFKRKTQTRLKV